jgi:non-ribosomal peptide synthetase component F
VGICLERGVEAVLSILGVLKAGGVYIPIDPHYPSDRISYIMEDSQSVLMITQSGIASELGFSGPEVLCLEEAWAEISKESSARF